MSHAAALRAQLRTRAEAWATAPGRVSYRSLGTPLTVLSKPAADNQSHGNFHEKSWAEIQRTPDWAARLTKRHSQFQALPEAERANAMELDSSNSSDALLMNCFCFPGAAPAILAVLGFEAGPQPGPITFGFAPMLRLTDGSQDTTEIDLRYGSLLFEAKLTESDFTTRPKAHVFRYASLLTVFEVDLLPGDGAVFSAYQLIRNVLAAHEHGASSIVLTDARRPDLREQWLAVSKAITAPGLSARCHLRTWQDVAKSAPSELAAFLETKYGL